MRRFYDVIQDEGGNIIAGAEVYVRDQGDNSLVSLYSDDGSTATANPAVSGSDGYVDFWTANNTLKLEVYVDGELEKTIEYYQHFDLDNSFTESILGLTTAAGGATLFGVGTGDSPQFTAVNLGHATDTTITRTGAGDIAIEGNAVYRAGGTDVPITDGGTGASTAAAAATNLGLGTGDSPQFTAINLGHASDTTIARSGAGDITIEGNAVYRAGGTDVALADGGTGASLADPGADRILFWDESGNAVTWLTVGTGLSITDTTINAGAGVWVLIETLSPSAVASIDSEGFAGGSYTELRFLFDLVVSTDGAQLQARYKLNGSYVSAANYRHGTIAISSSGSTNTVNSQTGTEIRCTGSGVTWGIGNASLEHATGELIVATPFSTVTAKHTRIEVMHINANGGITQIRGGGTFDGTDAEKALQGLRFLVDAGTMTGTIKVYGR